MPATVKELREKRKQAWEEQKRWYDERTKDGKALSAEDRTQWDKRNADLDEMSRGIADAERIESVDADLKRTAPTVPGREDTAPQGRGEDRDEDADLENVDLEARAIAGWLKNTAQSRIEPTAAERAAAKSARIDIGSREVTLTLPTMEQRGALLSRERRDQSIVNPTTGGFLRPEGFMARIERALLAFGGMRQVAEIIRTDTGNPLPWPTSDDTANEGAEIGESTAAGTTDVSFGSFVMGAYKYSSKFVKVPRELLEDAGVDVAGYIADRLGERLARIQNRRCTTGTGTGQPKGLTISSTSAFTSAAATAITPDELKRLQHSVDAAYRQMPGAGFMMNDSILGYIRTLKDGMGRYVFDVERVVGGLGGRVGTYNGGSVGYLLDGYPVYVNNHMTGATNGAPVSGSIHIEFGDLSSYKIREVRGIRLLRLVERFADVDQEGFIAFLRFDAGLLDAGTRPVKHILQA